MLINELSVCQHFLSSMKALQEVHTVNLLVTSRFIPHIIQEVCDLLCLDIRASDEDVHRYVLVRLLAVEVQLGMEASRRSCKIGFSVVLVELGFKTCLI